jgi:hypothetical protein
VSLPDAPAGREIEPVHRVVLRRRDDRAADHDGLCVHRAVDRIRPRPGQATGFRQTGDRALPVVGAVIRRPPRCGPRRRRRARRRRRCTSRRCRRASRRRPHRGGRATRRAPRTDRRKEESDNEDASHEHESCSCRPSLNRTGPRARRHAFRTYAVDCAVPRSIVPSNASVVSHSRRRTIITQPGDPPGLRRRMISGIHNRGRLQ